MGNLKQFIGKMFSIKHIVDSIEYTANHAWIGFAFSCVALWFEKIDSGWWFGCFIVFAFYNMIKRYIVPLIQLYAASQGIKDLKLPKE